MAYLWVGQMKRLAGSSPREEVATRKRPQICSSLGETTGHRSVIIHSHQITMARTGEEGKPCTHDSCLHLRCCVVGIVCNTAWQDSKPVGLPMRGILEAAGGVESASRSSNTKKATNMFIPVYAKRQMYVAQNFVHGRQWNNGELLIMAFSLKSCAITCGSRVNRCYHEKCKALPPQLQRMSDSHPLDIDQLLSTADRYRTRGNPIILLSGHMDWYNNAHLQLIEAATNIV